ncbi:MAG: pyrroline-5-carboxylate reductase [bacterium]|nr:pyrroline-5-carboxylate reductase [bacterium]
MRISFIGFGNMAKSIARGLIHEKVHHLSASAPSLTPGINKDRIQTHFNNIEIIKTAEVIILAVKPAQMSAVLAEIKPFIPSNCLIISVAAGLNLAWFATHCSENQAIIRTMPNTPSSIGFGATPMVANGHTTPQQKKIAECIFSTIGLTTWTSNEHDMDGFTALSGSGPAYVYLFLEALVQAAVSLGLNEMIAKEFTLQTVHGALNLAKTSDLSFTELRTQVTSPAGTTAAAIKVLSPKLEALVLAAMTAARNRSYELGQTY